MPKLKKLNNEEYKAFVESRKGKSLTILRYDAMIVKFKKDDNGNDLPIVESAWKLSDLL